MFDARSAELLEGAPSVPGLNSAELPQILTRHYAELMARRLQGENHSRHAESQWPLEKIADVYEIIASVTGNDDAKRSAAFVAGTAQQIMARESLVESPDNEPIAIDRDQLSASIAAALLFLVADQFADANEAGLAIAVRSQFEEERRLVNHARDLARGNLTAITKRAGAERPQTSEVDSIEVRAFLSLVSALADGIEQLASYILSEGTATKPITLATARRTFEQVRDLSSSSSAETGFDNDLRPSYPGPAHMASLLLAASDGLGAAALTRIPPPDNLDKSLWNKWLKFRARENPFVWQNHREAIDKDFHHPGISAVLVLPTGAGKTTVSTLKIAATLASGKKVVFLTPTHALSEQVTEDLQRIFPADEFGLDISSEFDSLLLEDSQLDDIEVMTPESCLAMLSYSPESFEDVGLLVFDECHLLSPENGRIGRALDGMLCLLTFCELVPEADLLFLSAMLRNAEEFASWVTELTRRKCIDVQLLWKPSRQARGVVVYQEREVSAAVQQALLTQKTLDKAKGKIAKGLRAAANRVVTARPYAVWGLRHNWAEIPGSRALTPLSDKVFPLGGGYNGRSVWAQPNANETAAGISAAAAEAGAKSIVFVNTKAVSVSTARKVASRLYQTVRLNSTETALWTSLELELGDSKHSVFDAENFCAVPHNASMLRLERMLSESLFKRADGAKVIVATPTLAQGLNLPAHLAILAGDKRSDDDGGREELEAHELLNAAARAGRAGHLANGIVLLVPEPLVTFSGPGLNGRELEAKLSSILPLDDRCVTITDPLETILDRIAGGDVDDKEVRYTVNRLATLAAAGAESRMLDELMARSFGAYAARRRKEESDYLDKVLDLWTEVTEAVEDNPTSVVLSLASKTGVPLDVLERLRLRLIGEESLPATIQEWVEFIFRWMKEDKASREHLLFDVTGAALKAAGKKTDDVLDTSVLAAIEPGVMDWICGRPLNAIEVSLGGKPDSTSETQMICPRARELTSTFVPRGLSFIAGVVARMVLEIELGQDDELVDSTSTVRSLSAAVRRGFDSPEKLAFANKNPEIFGRVEIHQIYEQVIADEWGMNDDL